MLRCSDASWVVMRTVLYCTVLYCTVLCTLYSVLCTLYSVLCTLYSVLCTLYSVLCTLYSVLCTLYSVLYCTVLYPVLYCTVLGRGVQPRSRLSKLSQGFQAVARTHMEHTQPAHGHFVVARISQNYLVVTRLRLGASTEP